MSMTELGLLGILGITFFGPFVNHKLEHNLEFFLFAMGIAAVSVSGLWSGHIIHEAFMEPIPISAMVLGAGYLFKFTRHYLDRFIQFCFKYIPQSLFIFLMVVVLGLASSIITAIIAAIILVELITIINLDRKTEINIVIISCFAIGLGAALTPLGEPLSTIIIAKMNVDFWYLARNFGVLIVPPIFVLALIAPWFHGRRVKSTEQKQLAEDTHKDVIFRAARVFIFVMALIFLGAGFKPLIDNYIIKLPMEVLYWLNTLSAILDNATLAAAEVGPTLSIEQLRSILMALLISGGMLIPGNIPNIIAASKLKITMREWAKLGVPLGFVMLAIYFVILKFI
jgi:predicted cation transporter